MVEQAQTPEAAMKNTCATHRFQLPLNQSSLIPIVRGSKMQSSPCSQLKPYSELEAVMSGWMMESRDDPERHDEY